jgi:hypothetical protein
VDLDLEIDPPFLTETTKITQLQENIKINLILKGIKIEALALDQIEMMLNTLTTLEYTRILQLLMI